MKHSVFIFLIAVSLYNTSCQRYYYRPNAVNAPLLKDRHDIHIAGAGMITENPEEKTSVFDFQAAYSPVKHIGVIGSFSTYGYGRKTEVPQIGLVNARAHLIEFGAGYYHTTGTKNINIIADIYAGAGGGKMYSDINMNGTRFFLQPGIGMRYKWADAAFNIRFAALGFSRLNTNGRDEGYLMQKELIDNEGNRIDSRTYFFYEPCLTIRAGYKFVKLQMQAVYTRKISRFEWNFSPGRATIGLHFNVEELFGL